MIGKYAMSALALSAALIWAIPLGAGPAITEDVPVDITSFDNCSGEDVHLTGTAEVSATVDINGTRAHIVGHADEHLTGMGLTSGATYIADARADISTNTDIDPVTQTGEAMIALTAKVIGQGNIPNTSERALAHITINANGTITASFAHVDFVCQ